MFSYRPGIRRGRNAHRLDMQGRTFHLLSGSRSSSRRRPAFESRLHGGQLLGDGSRRKPSRCNQGLQQIWPLGPLVIGIIAAAGQETAKAVLHVLFTILAAPVRIVFSIFA